MRTNLRNMPVVTIHLDTSDKQALEREAQKNGMQLATYCRMILLNSLNNTK